MDQAFYREKDGDGIRGNIMQAFDMWLHCTAREEICTNSVQLEPLERGGNGQKRKRGLSLSS